MSSQGTAIDIVNGSPPGQAIPLMSWNRGFKSYHISHGNNRFEPQPCKTWMEVPALSRCCWAQNCGPPPPDTHTHENSDHWVDLMGMVRDKSAKVLRPQGYAKNLGYLLKNIWKFRCFTEVSLKFGGLIYENMTLLDFRWKICIPENKIKKTV